MNLSRETRLFCGAILLTVPTITYGGATLLGILKGTAGLDPGGGVLTETQWALFRAGHAHAGVWVIFSLVLQLLLEGATLSRGSRLLARICAPVGAVSLSGG
jgi:drug/metabolite transporter superfamily protein YnfA